MAIEDLHPSPDSFPDAQANVTHLYRTAEVVILKKVRNFLPPGINLSEPESVTFQRDFFEFLPSNIGGKGILVESIDLEHKWQDPDAPFGLVSPANSVPSIFGFLYPLYKFYYVLATAQQSSTTASNVAPPPRGNADVVSVSATVSVEDRGSCTIEIASPQDKYLFKSNPFRYGQSLFEPNDQVFVNLPGLDGNLYRVFTGLVTRVTVRKSVGDTLQTRVVLECEDMLKLLAQTRTAVKPSITPEMSDGKSFAGMENDFSGRLPHDVMSEILGQAYCDFFTVSGYGLKLKAARANFNPTTAAKAEFSLNLSQTKLPTANPDGSAYLNGSPFLICGPLSPSVGSLVSAPVSINPSTTQQQTTIPQTVYGFRRVRAHTSTPSTPIDQAVKPFVPKAVSGLADIDDLAFFICGTDQPNFKIAFGSSPGLYFADFKSGLSLLKSISDDLNFEFFADHAGIIHFRPMNISLPFDVPLFLVGASSATAKLDQKTSQGKVGTEYWLQDAFILGSPEFSESDADIFTFAYVQGDIQLNQGTALPLKGIAVDVFKYLKFGSRTAPLVQRLQLQNNAACDAYAAAYLNRLNGNYSTAQIQYIGDARLNAGNPCYHVGRNTIYYISSITHNFVAGQSYTMSLGLKYGRRPIAVTGLTAARMTKSLNSSISALGLRKNPVLVELDLYSLGGTKLTGGQFISNFIRDNEEDLTFQDYIWEPLLPLDYESLYNNVQQQYALRAMKQIVDSSNTKSQQYTNKRKQALQSNPTFVPGSQADYNATVTNLANQFGVSVSVSAASGL